MSDATDQAASPAWTSPGRVLELALFLRVAAAAFVEWLVRQRAPGRVCLFPDSEYYWTLAGTIRQGTLYEIVDWGDIPHFALRPPGYPVFLAICRTAFGDRTFAVRVVQAALGMLTVWLVYRLSGEVLGRHTDPARSRFAAGLAALLAAVHPYLIAMSALVLSEALFVPAMMAAIWGASILWRRLEAGTNPLGIRDGAILLGVGLASGLAILIRPSWALFVPVMMAALAWSGYRGAGSLAARCRRSMLAPVVMLVGLAAVMSPWWARNAQIYGAFVPTALWMGASLYDGLNPAATGASDMAFLGAADIWPLGEQDQDQELTRRAIRFVRENPGRTLQLAIIKLGRFWCPWPNAEGFRSPLLAIASSAVMVPLLASMAVGLWRLGADLRAWVLLAGPLLYFCGMHMVFASSMRYRVPAEAPALGLAAIGLMSLFAIRHRPYSRA